MSDKVSLHSKYSILVVSMLVVLTLGVYWPVLDYDFVSYDDPMYVTKNSNIHNGITLDGVGWAFSTNYYNLWNPLVWLSFMLDFELFGFNASGYHLTNLVLHIVCAILLFYVFRNLTGSIWRSAFVAALFAIHPINVESVAWISERKNVLSTLFWLLTMLFYAWYRKKPNWKRYFPIVVSLALGLMSKQMLITLPFVLLLIDYWPLNRIAIGAQNQKGNPAAPGEEKEKLGFLILEKVPLLVLSAVFVWIVFYIPETASALQVETSIDQGSLIQRFGNAIYAYGMYLKKLLWPSDLYVPYLYLSVPLWHYLLSAFILIVITILVCVYYKSYPFLPVGWFWYLGTMVPVIGISLYAELTMADRYAYVTFIGLFVMIAWGAERVPLKEPFSRVLILAAILCIGLFALATYRQQSVWSDSVTLYKHTLDKDPKNYAIYTLMGKEMESQGNQEKALYYYDMALKYNPKAYASYNNKAVTLQRLGRRSEAIEIFKKAVQLKKYSGRAYYSIGLLFLEDNNLDKSEEYLSKAIEAEPDNIDAHNLLGVTFMKKGEIRKGVHQFEEALRIDPNNRNAQTNLRIAIELMSSGNPAYR